MTTADLQKIQDGTVERMVRELASDNNLPLAGELPQEPPMEIFFDLYVRNSPDDLWEAAECCLDAETADRALLDAQSSGQEAKLKIWEE